MWPQSWPLHPSDVFQEENHPLLTLSRKLNTTISCRLNDSISDAHYRCTDGNFSYTYGTTKPHTMATLVVASMTILATGRLWMCCTHWLQFFARGWPRNRITLQFWPLDCSLDVHVLWMRPHWIRTCAWRCHSPPLPPWFPAKSAMN